MLGRKGFAALLAVTVLVPAGIAYSSAGSGPAKVAFSSAHVYGGGQFGPGTFSNGNLTFYRPRDLSVDAHKIGAAVIGHMYYGVNDTGALMLGGDVKCLAVSGKRAAIGGIIRESTDPASVGYGFVIFMTDNGSPASAMRDRSSAAFVDPLSASEWPAGFPYTCPSPDGPFNSVGWLDVHSGDIVVNGG